MTPNGNTNQAIGLQLGWQSLVGGGPFPAPPAMDPNYKYTQVIILLTDGLNTQDRWYTSQNSIDARQALTCANVKAAGITLYTVQVNTGGDPTSTLLQNCASDSSKFFLLTSASQIVTAFTADRHRALQAAHRAVTGGEQTKPGLTAGLFVCASQDRSGRGGLPDLEGVELGSIHESPEVTASAAAERFATGEKMRRRNGKPERHPAGADRRRRTAGPVGGLALYDRPRSSSRCADWMSQRAFGIERTACLDAMEKQHLGYPRGLKRAGRRLRNTQSTKSPANGPGSDYSEQTLLYRRSLTSPARPYGVSLERLVGLLGEIGIELADLGRLGDEALVGGLRVVGLDLDRLVERLGAEQLLHDLGAVLEGLLRVVGDLGRDRLGGLGNVPNDFIVASMLSLLIFCTSSKFLIIVCLSPSRRFGGTPWGLPAWTLRALPLA